jgi:hypothetical protein
MCRSLSLFKGGNAVGYLLPTEYVEYGLSVDTSDDLVTTASVLMEAWCRRPSLLVTQYVDRLRITTGSQTARLTYRPLAPAEGVASPLISVRVRYARPRRGEMVDLFREQVAFAFATPGSWSNLDPASIDINAAAGELTFPANFLGLDYNEVEVTYTSGLVEIPSAVKVACAQIVKNAQAIPSLNVKRSRMDTVQMEYFSSALLEDQVQSLLRPYRAERLG